MRPLIWSFVLAAFFTLTPQSSTAAPEQKLTYNLAMEPRSLHPHKAQGVAEAHVILAMLECLTRIDKSGRAVPALAEKWTVSPDGRTYTFILRDAKWSNGDQITAADFVYGMTEALRPDNASQYAYHLFDIAGSEAFNKGANKDASSIGLRAVDARTLAITLVRPTPYFPEILAHYIAAPLNEKWVRAHPEWSSAPKDYLATGPFVMSEWRNNDRIILKKNPAYWNAPRVRLGTIVMRMITNESTALLEYETGAVDYLDALPLSQIPRLRATDAYTSAPYNGVYYVAFNNAKKPFDDVRVRRAFSLAINRQAITQSVMKVSTNPARALVPPGVVIDGKDYRAGAPELFSENVAEARKLLAEAGYPNGRGFPRVKYIFNDLEMHRIIGQAFQSMWQQNLGVRVDMEVQEWKVFLQNRKQGNYALARAGWIGDFSDPVAFLNIFEQNAGNNDVAHKNPKFDALVNRIRETTDTVSRVALCREAESLLMDAMPIAPVYYYVQQFMTRPSVKGIISTPLGYKYWDEAYIE